MTRRAALTRTSSIESGQLSRLKAPAIGRLDPND